MARDTSDSHGGFEQGPIRPPSEAYSLLVRVTRNCPWNRCTFCPVYKDAAFSLRSVDDVKRDIDSVLRHVTALRGLTDATGRIQQDEVNRLADQLGPGEADAFTAAFNWLFAGGLKSVFLQDANCLVVRPRDLIEILEHIRLRFPTIERITSYARAQTVAQRTEEDLRAIRDAGLDRLHVGFESGSDAVLEMVSKGCTQETQIEAGLKAKRAGFELSEYFMPGLGGRALSAAHAEASVEALNQIDPDFIRLRTLAIPADSPLGEAQRQGRFEKCTDVMVAEELLRFIGKLEGITTVVRSDHVLNLFSELEGTLPHDKEVLVSLLREFLDMPPERQRLYQVGRRLGIFDRLCDLENPQRRALAEETCRKMRITPENVDQITDEIVTGFI